MNLKTDPEDNGPPKNAHRLERRRRKKTGEREKEKKWY
jgi:hypothetical protein